MTRRRPHSKATIVLLCLGAAVAVVALLALIFLGPAAAVGLLIGLSSKGL